MLMKKLILIIAVLGLAWVGYNWQNRIDHAAPSASVAIDSTDDRALANAISNQQSNVAVHGHGVVTRLLPDDTNGIRHQRFIIQLDSGQTLLVAHNINVARRVDSLKVDDRVEFQGEYEWNPQGGVVHWTHRDPAGRHPSGWLKCNGTTFQ